MCVLERGPLRGFPRDLDARRQRRLAALPAPRARAARGPWGPATSFAKSCGSSPRSIRPSSGDAAVPSRTIAPAPKPAEKILARPVVGETAPRRVVELRVDMEGQSEY